MKIQQIDFAELVVVPLYENALDVGHHFKIRPSVVNVDNCGTQFPSV